MGAKAPATRSTDPPADDFGRAPSRVRTTVAELRGWRKWLVAIALGVVAVAALPPLHFWPALVPAFAGLFWLIDGRDVSVRGSFATGWCFGFGFFAAGLYWIFNAFLVRGEQFIWMAPLALAGLTAALAIFPALACALSRMSRVTGIGGVLVFSAMWTASEWFRGWALTGFPWNLIGTVWSFSDAMIQPAALFGTLGLSLITVIAATMPATLADPAVPRARSITATICAFLVVAAVWPAGTIRVAAAGDTQTVDGVRLRLVQPAIPQREKWRPGRVDEHLDKQLEMSASSAPPPTHVIWAETAAPLFLDEDPLRLARIGEFTPPGGLTILGTLRRSSATGELKLYNSLQAIDESGGIRATYDKVHLVPFGEYVPFRELFDVAKLTEGNVDFSPGERRDPLELPGLPLAGPLICYEVIFPGEVVQHGNRPDWLLNLTNDAWYGLSAGPYQHFSAARMRAVEEGLPLVRVANNGISAIIDAHGRIVARLGLGHGGIVDGPLPTPLRAATIYARLGDWSVFALIVCVGLAGYVLGRRRR